jgi:hypothetical protein
LPLEVYPSSPSDSALKPAPKTPALRAFAPISDAIPSTELGVAALPAGDQQPRHGRVSHDLRSNICQRSFSDRDGPFVFDVMTGDDDGHCIYGAATLDHEVAVQAALNILTVAAGLEGLSVGELERIRLLSRGASPMP